MWFAWLAFLALGIILVGGIVAGGVFALILVPVAIIAGITVAGSLVFAGRTNHTDEDIEDVHLAKRGRASLSPRQLTRLRTKQQ